jgi:multicomponent Na+:H+ antiporter subunit B
MITLLGMFLLTLLVITAFGIVRAHDLFVAAMLSGIFSLQMAAIFFVLDAADVALTEAAVGAGVATVFMLGALALTSREEKRRPGLRLSAVVVVVAVTLMVIYATFDKPRLGDPDAPVHQHVAPWYLSETPDLIGVPNVVTAVLASFRGYDTLGELFVIFTAGVGVLFVLGRGHGPTLPEGAKTGDVLSLRRYLIPHVVGRLLVPFIVLFGLYVQFHGDFGPGGGFQAGALVAAGMILHALIEGESAALRAIRSRLLTAMIAAGALLYTGVGLAGILLGGNFLDYSVLGATQVSGQHLGILLIELAVGITVTGVLLAIFHAFAARERPR